jgi:predicted CXXCH cytochrome family protein
MHKILLAAALSLGFLALPSVAQTGSEACLGCHNFGPESPVHPMLESKHGKTGSGCEGCHGPSNSHRERPTVEAPDVSYGPRWSATVAEQDTQCLACHADNVAEHWQDALHMSNNLTCVSCHDMHTTTDKALNPATQAQVCTVCHKLQKDGIHALQEMADDNPQCTTCHNPHGDQSAVSMMLANRSEGCRNCHDLVAMANNPAISAKATSYHRVMVQTDRTCLDCHQGVAHGAPGTVEPFFPLATAQRTVTLFYPGQSDIEWIRGEHPGAQPLRQGTNCQQCHRGEEAAMGASLGTAQPTSREVELRFQEDSKNLYVTITWQGDKEDADIAFMWGDQGNSDFRRGGCWAACHRDMPGMSSDRGLGLGKYLSVSRQQQQRIGQPPVSKDQKALAELMREGNFVELWRIRLSDGRAEPGTAVLLSELAWSRSTTLKATAEYSPGRWTVHLQRPLEGTAQQKSFIRGRSYTFGVAMHTAPRPGPGHWVSLPMTFSLDNDDTDFLAD